VRAIDTNLLARLMLDDDAAQAAAARRVVEAGALVPHTVLLETQWLLASFYQQSREQISEGLLALLAVDSVSVSDYPGIAWALSRYARGADLADMLHLLGSRDAKAFVTFDKSITRKAGAQTPVTVETLKI